MPDSIDISHLRGWIGSSTQADDVLTLGLAERFAATLDLPTGFEHGDPAPAGIHWCLAPALAPSSALGSDGHPARGGFLPPVPLPRRMWAGGELAFMRPFMIGETVRRISEVADVTLKAGSTGPLCFVTVRHDYRVRDESRLTERQDLVFRGLEAAVRPGSPTASTAMTPSISTPLVATPPLLFRYSALTFNGHRIHYDRRYCLEEEGYPGLVVHGPLQATLLLQLAIQERAALPARFRFRGASALFDGAFSINAAEDGMSLKLWCADPSTRATMTAVAEWA